MYVLILIPFDHRQTKQPISHKCFFFYSDGAKLTNIFSTQFIIECADTDSNQLFRQVFRDNMSVTEEPVIRKLKSTEAKKGDYVQVTFQPDLSKFSMTHLDTDTIELFSKRAYDIAGTMARSDGKRLVVSLNGEKLKVKNFQDYIKCFDGMNKPIAFCDSDRWEVGVGASQDSNMQQISFVNAICTSKGGRHVQYIEKQVVDHLMKVLTKKNKKTTIKKSQVSNHLSIMVNALIENPSFDSQTKDCLNTQQKNFGSKFKLPEAFLKKLEKSEIVDNILSYAQFKDRQALHKKGGTKKKKLTGIAKLDDANHAGTAKSNDCTLILTEGDSAKSLAVAGLSVVGRDYFGVFPLKGKPMNVRDASSSAVQKNDEIKHIVDILGLKFGQVYDEAKIKTLRYGHLLIMADQDSDGSHIKGLVINFLHHFWPSLLNVPGFFRQMITPIVKVSKKNLSRPFFNLTEYEQWLESTGNNGKGYRIKYYKGLGTSTSAEAKEYFANMDQHQIDFATLESDKIAEGNDDVIVPDKVHSGSDLIDMIFSKNRVADRKVWLAQPTKGVYLDYGEQADGVRFSSFFNKEYIHFSNHDNDRSIPHLIDGFKPSQRKVMFGCIKRKLEKNEVKVAQLTGYVAEHSSYHHGEASLQSTIVGMAQNFVGSNNINLLTPSGQFGTRRMGGKDAASPRYIFTKLEPIARAIFHPDDDELLNYLNDDGASIEPEYYVPTIPMVLCNGSDGIGTGWSSKVVNYDPREIIANLRRKIAGSEFQPMLPHYCGFSGEISKEKKDKFLSLGKIERVNDTTLVISELPIKKWTQDYKEFLETMVVGDEKKNIPVDIKELRENHTETKVSFTVICEKAKIDQFEKSKGGLMTKFKLTSSMSTSNMVLFSPEGAITKYETVESIMEQFYDIRLEFYEKRKANLMKNLRAEKLMLANKARFVEEVCDGTLVVSNRKKLDILQDLQQKGYDLIQKDASKKKNNNNEDESELSDNEDEEPTTKQLASGYDYLLGMKIWSLTKEKADELRSKLADKAAELEELEATAPTQIWLNDLDAVEAALDARDGLMEADQKAEAKAVKKNKSRLAKKKPAKKKKKDEWDSDMESDDEMEEEVYDSDNSLMAFQPKPVAKKKRVAPKPKVTKKPSPKAAPKAVPKPPPSPESESSDEEHLSLMERMKQKMIISPAGKATNKRPSPTNADRADESDDSNEQVAKKPAAKKKSRNLSPVTKVTKKKKAPTKKAPTKKDEWSDSSDDELDFKSSGDESVEVVNPIAASRARRERAAPAKKTQYAFSDDSEEEDFGNDSDF